MELTSMTENINNSSLPNQVYDNMRLKETEELIEIWKRGDRTEWSDTAIEVVKEILLERLGELPPQELVEEKGSPEDEPRHNENKLIYFFFQAEDGIRVLYVTGVQTCALPICQRRDLPRWARHHQRRRGAAQPGSEERRVGKECRFRFAPNHYKKTSDDAL